MGVVKSAHARAPAPPPRRRARNHCRRCHSPGEAGSEAKDLEKLPARHQSLPQRVWGILFSKTIKSRTGSQHGRTEALPEEDPGSQGTQALQRHQAAWPSDKGGHGDALVAWGSGD